MIPLPQKKSSSFSSILYKGIREFLPDTTQFRFFWKEDLEAINTPLCFSNLVFVFMYTLVVERYRSPFLDRSAFSFYFSYGCLSSTICCLQELFHSPLRKKMEIHSNAINAFFQINYPRYGRHSGLL